MSHQKPRRLPLPEFEAEITRALQDEDYERLLEVLETAPDQVAKQPEILLMRAVALLALDEEMEGIKILLDLEKSYPHFLPIYVPLVNYYMEAELPAHAIQAARHALKDTHLPKEGITQLNEAIEDSTKSIQTLAAEFGLPYETMFRAFLSEENSVMALQQDNFSQADFYARETIKLAPMWEAAYNNRAKALYYSGRAAEAVAICEEVLARDPENMFALYTLTFFYTGLGQDERAIEYARRLELLSRRFAPDAEVVDFAIWSLALLEDTSRLWEVAGRYSDASRESLYSRSWYCLAVAAVRSGQWLEARKLIKKADRDDLPSAGTRLYGALTMEEIQGKDALGWLPPAYPGVELLMNQKILQEYESLTSDLSASRIAGQRRKLGQFFQKYPFILTGFRRLLWEEATHPPALLILLLAGRPDADAEILRFATSQTGPLENRIHTLVELSMNERYAGLKTVQLWDENLGEWREVEVFNPKISDIQPKAQPKTLELIEKAGKTEDPEKGIALLRKAVELEPDSPIAVFNLGVTLITHGRAQEGEALTYRSVEIDPGYCYGHASIALVEADRGHYKEAREHLQAVNQASVISPDTAVTANLAYATLALHENDLVTARYRIEIATWIDAENPALKRFQEELEIKEYLTRNADRIVQRQRKSATHTHQRLLKTPLTADMDLHTCLMMNTRDMLVASAHVWGVSPSGNKEKIITDLVKALLDEAELKRILSESLREEDRAALRWLSENKGVRPWDEFTGKFGDDMQGSVYWDYHEPKSTPGVLRRAGLLFTGMLEGQQVAFLPASLRPLLDKLL